MREHLNQVIAENIRKHRLKKGLKQEEVTKGICSVSQFSKIENGKSSVKRELLAKIAARLGVSLEHLQTADQEKRDLHDLLELSRNARMVRQFQRALEYARTVLEESKKRGDHELFELALDQEILALTRTFRWQEVIERLEHVLFVERAAFSPVFRTIIDLELGRAHAITGDRKDSYMYFLQGEDRYLQLTDQELDPNSVQAMRINYLLGRGSSFMRNHHSGLRYGREATRLAELNDLPVDLVECRTLCGGNLFYMGRIDEAEELYLQILEEAQSLHLLYFVATMQGNLGGICEMRKELGKAWLFYQRALKNFELLDGWEGKCDALLFLAEIHLQEQDIDTMLDYIGRAGKVLDEHHPHGYMYRAFLHELLSRLRLTEGNWIEAGEELKRTLQIYETHHVYDGAFDTSVDLANLYDDHGDIQQAVTYYREAIRYDKLNVPLK